MAIFNPLPSLLTLIVMRSAFAQGQALLRRQHQRRWFASVQGGSSNQPYAAVRLAPIEERAPWDNFWGTGAAHAGGQGRNMLGRLLVELRDNLLQGGQQQQAA